MSDVPKLLKPLVGNGSIAAVRELLAWAFRGFVIITFLWMKATFVSVEQYQADRGKAVDSLTSISNSLAHIDEKLSKGVDVDSDHEKRLRVLERAPDGHALNDKR